MKSTGRRSGVFLGDTVVVDTLDQARKLMGGVRLVTQGGELLEASGAMVGGNTESSGLSWGQPQRVDWKKYLSDSIQAISSSEHLAADSSPVRAKLLEIESKMHEASGAGGASSVTMKALESRRTELKNKLAASKEEMAKKALSLKLYQKHSRT